MMRVVSDIFLGARTYLNAMDFIHRHRLWYFFLFPVLLVVLLWVGGYVVVDAFVDFLELNIQNWLGLNTEGGEGFWHKLRGLAMFSFKIMLRLVLFFFFFTTIKYLMMIFLSPVYAYLSELTEKKLTGKDYPFDLPQFVRDVYRGVLIALRNFFLEICAILLATIIGAFVPLIGWLAPLFLFVVESYFYGFSFMDYTNERRRLNVNQSIHFIRNNRGIAIGNGSVFSLLFFLPFIGPVVAPILGVVAATLAIHEHASQSLSPEKIESKGNF